MKYKMPCEIAQDLMPTYVDGLTSELTNEAMSEHMQECQECRNLYNIMREPEKGDVPEPEKKEIDFLKRNRRRGRIAILVTAILATLVVGIIFAARLFAFGSPETSELLECNVTVNQEESTIFLSGHVIDEKKGVSQIDWNDKGDGVVDITVKTTMASMFHRNQFESDCVLDFAEPTEIRTVTLNGSRIIWSDGENISSQISDLYQKMNPYVGDMVADNQLANALGLHSLLGPYKNELQTTTEPYGWKVLADMPQENVDLDALDTQLRSIGIMLLATVDNLGYMEFEYSTGADTRNVKVEIADADKLLGTSVKDYVHSAADLKKLLTQCNLLGTVMWDSEEEDIDLIQIAVCQKSFAEIYQLSVELQLNGEAINTSTAMNADESAIKMGDVFNFDFGSRDLDHNISSSDELSIVVTAADQNGAALSVMRTSLGQKSTLGSQYRMQVLLEGDSADSLMWEY